MRTRFAFLILVSVVGAATFLAQENTGSFAGTVHDPSNAVIAGATIEISGPALGRSLRLTTDAAGSYVAPNLPPGQYAVTAAARGFTTEKMSGLELLLGRQLRTNFNLGLADLRQTIDISEKLPLIDVESSQTSMSLTREVIDSIPKQRSFQTLAALAPGAQWESKTGTRGNLGLVTPANVVPGGGLQVDGATGTENVWLVDGGDTTGLAGFPGMSLPMDWIQELQVKSSGFAAEYGGALGGVVNAVTRSGGNEVHGEMRYYYYGSRLQARPRPRLQLNTRDQRIAEYVRDPKDREIATDFGFDLGGPVVKNRAWYFLGYQPVLDHTYRTVSFLTPQVTRQYKNSQNAQYWTAKLTLQPWDRLRTNFSVQSGSVRSAGMLPSYAGTQNPDAGFERQGSRSPNITYNANTSLRASRNLFFNFRLGYLFKDAHSLGINDQTVYTFAGSPQNYFNQLAPDFQHFSGWASGSPNGGTSRATDTRLNGSADGSWFSRFHGSHNLKFGYQFNRLKEDLLQGQQLNDSIVVYFDETYTNLNIVTRGKYGYYYNRFTASRGKPVSYNHALYVQDAWQPLHRLTLNLGIRTEHETVPSYRTDSGIPPTAIRFPFSSKIAPRTGFSYDVRGDGRSKVYGSFGLYYDMMKYTLSLNNFGAFQNFYDYYTLDTLDIGSIGRGNYPGQKIERVDVTLPSNAPQPALGGRNLIDPNLKPMRAHEYTTGYERNLGRDWTLDLRYTRKRLDRTIEDVGGATKYFIANPGEGLASKIYGPGCDPLFGGSDCAAYPATPKPSRRYDGLEARLQGRVARDWQSVVSYTLSRLYGNYSGLTNSDVVGGFGFGQPLNNAGSAFDTPYQYVDASARYIDGPLATDRTHTFKYYGSYRIPWGRLGLKVGGVFVAGSGTPTTRGVNGFGGMLVENRNSEGRLAAYSQTNLYVARDFTLSERSRVRVDFNLENVFNQSTPTNYVTNYTRDAIASGIPGSPIQNNADAVHGFDYKKQIEVQANYNRPASCGSFADDPYCPSAPMRLNPQFLKANVFQGPRTGRFSVRFMF